MLRITQPDKGAVLKILAAILTFISGIFHTVTYRISQHRRRCVFLPTVFGFRDTPKSWDLTYLALNLVCTEQVCALKVTFLGGFFVFVYSPG